MNSIQRLFTSRTRNKCVDFIVRGINTYSLQFSDDNGYFKHLELTWTELEILGQLVRIAENHHNHGTIPDPENIETLDVLNVSTDETK